MESRKSLSFENIVVRYEGDFIEKFIVQVLDDNLECLAEAKCEQTYLKDFSSEWYYPSVVEPEIDYFYYEVLNDEEREKTRNMGIADYIEYLNDKCSKEDTEILNSVYEASCKLQKHMSSNLLNAYSSCVKIKSIHANYEGTEAGTLIVDYLKSNFSLIFLYSDESSEGYWLEKAKFNQIMNYFMFWTDNEKIKEIL